MIVKHGSTYEVKSEDGSRSLGHYKSKAEAVKRLRQVEYWKHVKGKK